MKNTFKSIFIAAILLMSAGFGNHGYAAAKRAPLEAGSEMPVRVEPAKIPSFKLKGILKNHEATQSKMDDAAVAVLIILGLLIFGILLLALLILSVLNNLDFSIGC